MIITPTHAHTHTRTHARAQTQPDARNVYMAPSQTRNDEYVCDIVCGLYKRIHYNSRYNLKRERGSARKAEGQRGGAETERRLGELGGSEDFGIAKEQYNHPS